jgi:hypothetical protein
MEKVGQPLLASISGDAELRLIPAPGCLARGEVGVQVHPISKEG